MKIINPDSITKPASNYAMGVQIDTSASRVLVSGQCGVTPQGEILQGTDAQMRRSFENVFEVLKDAGLTRHDIIKLTVFLTRTEDVVLYRDVRDEMMEGHTCASTLLVVSALAHPDWTVEIEAEAAG